MEVLIAEDDPISRELLETFLNKWGYDTLVTRDGGEAWEALQNEEPPSLVVSDWMMPNMDGLELCRKIRQMRGSGYIYFILLTTKGRKEDIVKGLDNGADDYLSKPFNHDELKCRIKIGERIIKLERQILQLADTDSLTGVFNRRAFMKRMKLEFQRSRRGNSPFSLILADIDHFKELNDTYGHQVGDLVLQRFTEQLSSATRPYDFVGRYGGEEFVVCLPGTNGIQSGSVAERMCKSIKEMEIELPETSLSNIKMTASFGVASLLMESDESVDSLIKRADEAMYRAKNSGRNRVCIAGE